MSTPAMIIDFEATDVSKEAEATQLGYQPYLVKACEQALGVSHGQ